MVNDMKNKIMGKRERLNQRGIALIWVYLLSAFLTTMIYSFYSLSIWQVKTDVVDSSAEIQAFYLAESAVDDIYKDINDLIAAGSEPEDPINISGDFGADKTYTASYDPETGIVNAIGTASVGNGSIIKKLFTKIIIGTPYDIPPGVQAGVTAASAVELTGLLVIDGRNHSPDGEVIEDGISGIAYYQDAAEPIYDDYVSIGGPSNSPNEPGGEEPVDPTSILAINSNGYLLSPEAVFGLTEGDFNTYKNSMPPSSTVNGIYYYEAPQGSGGSVSFSLGDTENPGSGVIVIDNVNNPSMSVGISGSFNGILIVRNGNFNLEAGTVVAGALVNVSASNSTVSISGPAFDPDGKNDSAKILYCVQCVEGSSLPEGLNNSTVAGVGSWVNFRSTSNPLVSPPIIAPPAGNGGGGGKATPVQVP